jgi:chromate reductase
MITIISGTNRKGSNTGKIACQYKQILCESGVSSLVLSLEGIDVRERNGTIETLEEELLVPTDKFIFIVPEYNGSIPGVLKCFIDVTDIRRVWWGKKALLTGISTGRAGNLRGMDHLTGILNYMKIVVHPYQLPIPGVDRSMDEQGLITDHRTLASIHSQLKEFLSF